MGDLRYQRIIGVGVCEHGADREKHFGDGQGWAPLVSQNVEAYATVGVDVWVVDARSEVDLGRLEWVVGREVYGKEENAS